MKKALIIGGLVSVVGVVLLYLYYKSKSTVSKGQEYDLANADIWALSNTPTTPPTSTGSTATAGGAPRYAVDSRTEPAASLVAQTVESFLLSANTMNRIKERIGYNSGLFRNITQDYVLKFQNAFSNRFDINPNSLLSYPTWTPDKSPALIQDLTAKKNVGIAQSLRASQLTAYGIVNAWNINFANYGINPTQPADFLALKQFYTNCYSAITGLMDAVRTEACQYLRNQGWRFTDYGDVN